MQYKPDAARLSTMHSPTLDLGHMMSDITCPLKSILSILF